MELWYSYGMYKLYPVHLTEEQVTDLQHLIHTGSHPARVLTRARTLVLAHHGQRDQDIAAALLINKATVQRTRQRFVHEGLPAALHERPRSGRPPVITGHVEAHLTMLACSSPPAGRARWTLQLLTNQILLLEEVEQISPEAIRQRLHQHQLKPWRKKQWCVPQPGARFVAKMEEVLAVYARPYDPRRPLLCVDEASKELHADGRPAQAAAPGRPARQDYEYVRHGTGNLFVWVEPLVGQRGVQVTAQRTSVDFAELVRYLVEEQYPEADQLVLVVDNLNTHGPWALYEAFPPEQAQRIAEKIEWHYTPEHGSWLNMAEIEIGVLRGQCLDRRIADRATLAAEVAAWVEERNAAQVTIDWQFTTAEARIKLKRLYPVRKPQHPAELSPTSQN